MVLWSGHERRKQEALGAHPTHWPLEMTAFPLLFPFPPVVSQLKRCCCWASSSGAQDAGCSKQAHSLAPLMPTEVTAPLSPSPEPQSQRAGCLGVGRRAPALQVLPQARPGCSTWKPRKTQIGNTLGISGRDNDNRRAPPGLDYCKIAAIAAVYNSSRSNSFFIVFSS